MEEETLVKNLLESRLKERGYDLYEISYKPTSKDGPRLDVVVDKPTPISLDEIVELSDFISSILDEEDPIEKAYVLDVSSAGAEKRIDVSRLKEYIGQYVWLHLDKPYKGENILEGEIEKIENDELTLSYKIKGRTIKAILDIKNIDKARLAIKF